MNMFDMLETISMDMVASQKASLRNLLEIKLDQKELPLLVAQLFLHSEGEKLLIGLWGLNPNIAFKHCALHVEMPKPSTAQYCLNTDVLTVAYKSAGSLNELMEAIICNLWTHHEKLEAIKAQRAGHKLHWKILPEMKKRINAEENRRS